MSSRNQIEMESHADIVRERQIKRLSGIKGYTCDYFDIPLDIQEYKNYKKVPYCWFQVLSYCISAPVL